MNLGMFTKRITVLLLLVMQFLVLPLIAIAPPPAPHSIAGYIFAPDSSTQVPLGTPFTINDTTTFEFLKSQTRIPVPGLTGRYSETINGSDGDSIKITSWNASHHGSNTVILVGEMDNVNVLLVTQRPSETNVTILTPVNHTIYNVTANFSVSARIMLIGNNGTGCNATLTFGNATILNISSGDLINHSIGNIPRESSVETTWNVTGGRGGNTSLRVQADCMGDGVNFEGVSYDTKYNITVLDNATPVVNLMTPVNNSRVLFNDVTFEYNVSDHSAIANCSLLLNNIYNATNSSTVIKNSEQNIIHAVPNGNYNWTVQCFDIFGNAGTSGFFNVTVNAAGPVITNTIVTNPIDLTAGSTTLVWCNATIAPSAITVNITRVNATFYDFFTSTHASEDDNSNHYTNSTCKNFTLMNQSGNFTCGFSLWYYASNSSWLCNLTATDTDNRTSFSFTAATMNQLLALNSTSLIDYGALAPESTSAEKNVTLFNLGNTDLNVTARGYGRVVGDNLSMSCGVDGNISVGQQHHTGVKGTPYFQMNALTNQSTLIANFTLPKRTSASGHTNDTNFTFWSLQVPSGIGGKCNGTILLTAIATR